MAFAADLDWIKRQHEREVADLRHHHEDQLNQVREELSTTSHHVKHVVLNEPNLF